MSGLGPAEADLVERVRLALADAEGVGHGADRAALVTAVTRLRGAVETLLRIVDGLPGSPRSERLAAQQDAQFRNVVRAARSEIGAARASLSRLDAFETALAGMLWPEERDR